MTIFGPKSPFWSDSLQKGSEQGGSGGRSPPGKRGVRGRSPRNYCSNSRPSLLLFSLPPSLFSLLLLFSFSFFLLLFSPKSYGEPRRALSKIVWQLARQQKNPVRFSLLFLFFLPPSFSSPSPPFPFPLSPALWSALEHGFLKITPKRPLKNPVME